MPQKYNKTYCGFAIDAGTRDEAENEQGMAHFVEHLIFKGTEKRKAWLILNRMEKSEVLVALPGGVGTLDEIFHVIAAASIGYHRKKVIFYNEYGFYDELLKALHTLEDKGFARQPFSTYYEVANTLNELKEKIN